MRHEWMRSAYLYRNIGAFFFTPPHASFERDGGILVRASRSNVLFTLYAAEGDAHRAGLRQPARVPARRQGPRLPQPPRPLSLRAKIRTLRVPRTYSACWPGSSRSLVQFALGRQYSLVQFAPKRLHRFPGLKHVNVREVIDFNLVLIRKRKVRSPSYSKSIE